MALTKQTMGMTTPEEPRWERTQPADGPFEPLVVTDLRFTTDDNEGPVTYLETDEGTIHAVAGGGFVVYPGGEGDDDGPQVVCNDIVTAVRCLKEASK